MCSPSGGKPSTGSQGIPGLPTEPRLQSRTFGTIPCGDGSGRQPGDGSAEPGGSEEHSKEAPSRLRGNCSRIEGIGSNRVWLECKARRIPRAKQVLPRA